MKLLCLFILVFVFFGHSNAYAQNSDLYSKLIERENMNQHFEDMKFSSLPYADQSYRPQIGRFIDIQEILIPSTELEIVQAENSQLNDIAYVEMGGVQHFRFLIHPASRELYQHLIDRYGVHRTLKAQPTSSTRTVLVPSQPGVDRPFFAKLSMDQMQFGFGRVVPDWEVRRSVRISDLASDFEEHLKRNGITLIREDIGAYVSIQDSKLPKHKVADNQPIVLQHGMIYRDASFLEEYNHLEIYPLFALFDAPSGQRPLILKMWERSDSSLSFEDYVSEVLIEPFVKSTSYLAFKHGLFPEAHGQNVLVGIDPTTQKVVHFFHRDLGSIKVHFALRILNGLSITKLITKSTLWDFKPNWIDKVVQKPFSYFYDFLFSISKSSGVRLKLAHPNYSPSVILNKITDLVEREAIFYFGARTRHNGTLFSLTKLHLVIDSFLRTQTPNLNLNINAQTTNSHQHVERLSLPWKLELDSSERLSLDHPNVSLQTSQNNTDLVITSSEGNVHHYETHVKVRDVFVGQSYERETLTAIPAKILEDLKRIPRLVAKVGTKNRFFFIPITGSHFFNELTPEYENQTLPVEVTADMTALPIDTQSEILENVLGEKIPRASCRLYFN